MAVAAADRGPRHPRLRPRAMVAPEEPPVGTWRRADHRLGPDDLRLAAGRPACGSHRDRLLSWLRRFRAGLSGMMQPRHPPLIAFFVGMLGIALFSGMDAVMKGLVLAIGAF